MWKNSTMRDTTMDFLTPNERKMTETIGRKSGVNERDINAFIEFAAAKHKQFGNVYGGYNPETAIESVARKFLKAVVR
jgi:hypothetical protein